MSATNTSTGRTLELTVHNTGFLLDRLGEDCHPLQFLRELTQNSIEAILRTGGSGDVHWDVDWNSYELSDEPVFKLSVTDNGDGMTGEEMVGYINQLSSSGSLQSFDGNYGVGAKIAAATRNHAGLIYMSWKNGHGAMIHMWRDPETGQYGLRQFERPDGSWGHFAEIDDDVKPSIIEDHGTKVVLLGNAESEDTMRAPEHAQSPSRWVARYLNARYFRFPDGIRIRAREGWENPRPDTDRNLLRTVQGASEYLSQHAESSGKVDLRDASAHWWVLKKEPALTQNSGWAESSGHMAALYNDELYEIASGRAGRAQLQNFGVLVGTSQVVIYIEPTKGSGITTNTARTQLLVDRQPLPWSEWANEFRDKMPTEIRAHMDSVADGADAGDHTKAIRDRLRALLDLFKVTRYRPSPTGKLEVDPTMQVRVGRSPQAGDPPKPRGGGTDGRTGSTGGSAGGVYSAFLKQGGVTGEAVRGDIFPTVEWVSTKNGTRESGDIEDRAARYVLNQNVLLINADFRVFGDMVSRWRKELGSGPLIEGYIEEAVHNWFEQSLVESVIGIQALRDSKEWAVDDINAALSEEALTAVVMQRYHVYNSVKRELGSKLGRIRRDE